MQESIARRIISKYRYQLGIAVLWGVIIFIVNPYGEFPVNDDWAYAHNTYELSVDGVFYFSWWPAMTLVSQTMWGAFFCKIFGYSFFAMRMATLTLAFGSSLAVFGLIKYETKNAVLAFASALLLMCSPMFMGQSFTYMTEIYDIFFMSMSLLFYARFFRNERMLDFLLAIVFTVITIWVRQTALIIPIAFAITYLLSKRIHWKSILALIPFAIGLWSLELYKNWRVTVDPNMGSLSEIGDLFRAMSDVEFSYYIDRIGVIFHYAGFALIPITLVLAFRLKGGFSPWQWIRFGLILLPILYCMLVSWNLFPFGNLLQNFYLGPHLIKDVDIFKTNGAIPVSEVVLHLFRVINFISVAVLVHFIFSFRFVENSSIKSFFGITKAITKRPFLVMLLLLSFGQITFIVINPIFFDRYVIPLSFTILIVVALIVREIPKKPQIIVFSLASVFLLISTLLTRDLLSWHRARWQAIDHLEKNMKIPQNHIDGGFEFNAYRQFAMMGDHPVKTTDKSWWFVEKDYFVITAGELEGYEKVKGFPCYPTISTTTDSIFIMRNLVNTPETDPVIND